MIEKGFSKSIVSGGAQPSSRVPSQAQKSLSFSDDSQKDLDPLGIEPRTFCALKANHSDVKQTLMVILEFDIDIRSFRYNILIPLDHESLTSR